MTERLDGDVALVTGASSGIGEATALALAAEGATVALAARREERLRALADEIEADGGEALVVPTDLAEAGAAARMVEEVVETLGSLDVLVNNAGVMLLEPVWRSSPENLRSMVEVNLLGLMNACRAAVPVMDEQGTGHIVNVSSVAGRRASAGSAGYNATKFGVNGFSEALRQEVTERGTRVTVVEPGAVDTELQQHIPDEAIRQQSEEMFEEMTALEPVDIAEGIRYAVTQPQRVSVNELLIRPTDQRR